MSKLTEFKDFAAQCLKRQVDQCDRVINAGRKEASDTRDLTSATNLLLEAVIIATNIPQVQKAGEACIDIIGDLKEGDPYLAVAAALAFRDVYHEKKRSMGCHTYDYDNAALRARKFIKDTLPELILTDGTFDPEKAIKDPLVPFNVLCFIVYQATAYDKKVPENWGYLAQLIPLIAQKEGPEVAEGALEKAEKLLKMQMGRSYFHDTLAVFEKMRGQLKPCASGAAQGEPSSSCG